MIFEVILTYFFVGMQRKRGKKSNTPKSVKMYSLDRICGEFVNCRQYVRLMWVAVFCNVGDETLHFPVPPRR